MTAISAFITKDWIGTASDSLVIEFHPKKNEISQIDFKKSKIVPIRKFKAAAAFWGLAKVEKWNTYDFLIAQAAKADSFTSFEDFANTLKAQLENKLNSIPVTNPDHKGIGIHLVGFESINNQDVPELFLISNYTDLSYSHVGELAISRRLFDTLPDELKTDATSIEKKREKIMAFLNDGKAFIFNNGDPILFMPVANTVLTIFNVVRTRNVLKTGEETFAKFVSSPIEIIKNIQKGFFDKKYIRVGGKIHNLLITKQGDFISSTGDNRF